MVNTLQTTLVGIFIFVCLGGTPGHAGLVLSFVPDNTEVNIGDTIDVSVILTQTTPTAANSLLVDDGLITFSVPFNRSGPHFVVTNFAVSAPFDDALSSNNALQGFSFVPVTGTSLTLGTYTLTAASAGSIAITTADTSVTNFSFDSGTMDDLAIFASFAAAPTLTATAVPEPSSMLLLGLIGCLCTGRAYLKNRVKNNG